MVTNCNTPAKALIYNALTLHLPLLQSNTQKVELNFENDVFIRSGALTEDGSWGGEGRVENREAGMENWIDRLKS
jgi:hypothetical protein